MYHRSRTKKTIQYVIIVVIAGWLWYRFLQTPWGQQVVHDIQDPSSILSGDISSLSWSVDMTGWVTGQIDSPQDTILEQRLEYYREHKAELWSGSEL